MASQRLFQATLSLSILLLLSDAQTDQGLVTLYKLESLSSLNVPTVQLQCSTASSVTGNKTFFREVNGVTEMVTDRTENTPVITFELRPNAEGYYYCQAGEVSSSRLLILAEPVLDRRITSTRLAPVSLGATVCVPCAYQRGRLNVTFRQQEVMWFKGMQQVDTATMPRYQISTNFSLVIRDVMSGDASDAYSCQVRVTKDNVTVVKQAPVINVNVIKRIRITELPQEKIITANEKAQFTCQVNGVPDPTIKWLFNGQEIDTTNEWKIELRNDLIRTSMVNLNSSLGSGQVMCIGYHMEEGRLVMVSSEAHLIVLTDKLTPQLVLSEEGARLEIQFPSLIPGQFDIVAYYKYQNFESRRVISHPTFRNTREVNIVIPLNKLPNFRTFAVRVALSVANKTGGMSVQSNQITLGDELPSATMTESDCYCPEVDGVAAASSNSPVVVGVLSFFIVLLFIAIVVGIVVGVLVFLCYKRMKIYTAKDSADEYDNTGGRFSMERDITKTPNSYETPPPPLAAVESPEAAKKHCDDGFSDIEGDLSEEEGGDGRSHKDLEQWDEKQREAAVITVDDETGIRVRSNDFVEYQPRKVRCRDELPFVTNPALLHYNRDKTAGTATKMKPSDSSSSFEDLEEEFDELKMEAPRTM